MSVNGKRDGFDREDLLRCADVVSMQRARTQAAGIAPAHRLALARS